MLSTHTDNKPLESVHREQQSAVMLASTSTPEYTHNPCYWRCTCVYVHVCIRKISNLELVTESLLDVTWKLLKTLPEPYKSNATKKQGSQKNK